MTEREYTLKFYTPGYDESLCGDGSFGCASLGLVSDGRWADPAETAVAEFPGRIKGILVNADMDEARGMIDGIDADVKAGVVFFGNCGGENSFMKALASKFPGVPFAGGSPAIGPDGAAKRMLPGRKEVSALFITDDRYDIRSETLNVYGEILAEAEVTGGVRSISDITVCGKTERFHEYIQRTGKTMGIRSGLTERIAVSDMSGRNIHLIEQDGQYVCGTDLPGDRRIQIRYTTRENVRALMEDFYSSPDSLIFGCAGVKSNLGEHAFRAGRGSLGMFMFGEVVSIEGSDPDFANLMLTKLVFKER